MLQVKNTVNLTKKLLIINVNKMKTYIYRLTVLAIITVPIVFVVQRYASPRIVLQRNASSVTTINWINRTPPQSLLKNMFYRLPYNLATPVTIACHFVNMENSLPAAEDITPPPDSIFFLETSCRGGLTSRQACSVESAARLHPNRDVYIFFNAPISDFILQYSCLANLIEFKNVKLARIHTDQYAKGTALGKMLARRENTRSDWPVQLTADMLRFITLYKYGGIYLDLDMLVVKPLDALGKNWAAMEDTEFINVAVMAIGQDELGRTLTANVLNDIEQNYDPQSWTNNGPDALHRALLKLCNASDDYHISPSTCSGFEIYDHELFYPIHFDDNGIYFTPGDLPKNITEKAYGYHLWNKMSFDKKVKKNSPYEKLATEYCPTTKNLFGKFFGT